MIQKIVRYLYLILIIFVPLVMSSSTSELFEFNKVMLIYVIATLVGLALAADTIIYNKRLYHQKWMTVALTLFLASEIISTIFSIDPHTSLFGYYGRFNGGLYSIISYIILFYGFIQYFDRKSLSKYLNISLFTSVIVMLWGLPGKFGYDLSCYAFMGQLNNNCWTDQFRPAERMFSTLGQPNWLGAYLAINFFIGMYIAIEYLTSKNKHKHDRTIAYIYITYMLLNYICVLFTKSRSALASILVGLIIYPIAVFLFDRNLLSKKVIYTGVVTALLFIIPLFIFKTGVVSIDKYLTLPSFKQQKITKLTPLPSTPVTPSQITDSLNIRKIVWEGAWKLGSMYPLFGTGLETFAYSYYFVRPIAHNQTSEWDFLYNKAHNEYLNYLATTGYVGLLTYLLSIAMTVVLAIIYMKKTKNINIGMCLLLSYVSILITNFFGFSTSTVSVFFYLTPAFLIVMMYQPEENIATHVFETALKPKNTIAGVVILSAGLYMLFSIARYYEADLKYASADRYSHSGDYQTAATLLQDALNLHSDHVYQDKLSYILSNLAYLAAYQKEADVAKRLVGLAQYYNDTSLQQSPKNILYWKTKIKNDYLFYQIFLDNAYIVDGIRAMDKANAIAPTDPKLPYSASTFYSILQEDAKTLDDKNKYEKLSLDSISKAIDLKPDYRDSYMLKGQLLKKFNHKDQARDTFNYILNNINPNDQEVVKEINTL